MESRSGWQAVTSHGELRELMGEPGQRSRDKVRDRLTDVDREWLAASALCFVGTSDADGRGDVSPKGDPPGFTLVLDETAIAIPERPGNKRADGFHNVLDNPHVGLIFLVPGRTDTLRINGRATLVRDAPFFDAMTVEGHRPVFALVVAVEEVFYHCAKAFLRSQAWQPETWRPEALPSRAQIVKRVEAPEAELADLERHYGPRYAAGLYGGAG
jgi:PPOX class probable FMN-dependent enzyme